MEYELITEVIQDVEMAASGECRMLGCMDSNFRQYDKGIKLQPQPTECQSFRIAQGEIRETQEPRKSYIFKKRGEGRNPEQTSQGLNICR